jgi:hypothetical protein
LPCDIKNANSLEKFNFENSLFSFSFFIELFRVYI